MKATEKINGLKAIVAFIVLAIFLSSCQSCKKDPDPVPVPPVILVKPQVFIKEAIKITLTAATLTASVIPGEAGTKVSFAYREINSSDWQLIALPLVSGKDTIKLTFDLSGLKPNTEYSFCLKAENKAVTDPVTSEVKSFTTYAVSDFDGNLYHTVIIGNQTWLKENFRGTHYANGDPIPNVTDPVAWSKMTTGAYCWYNNNPELGKVYGGLYNGYVATDPRALIVGWQVPTGNQWATLGNYLKGYFSAGPALMDNSSLYWLTPARPATNSSGFTALPNGAMYYDASTGKNFVELGETAYFFTSSPSVGGICGVSISNKDSNLILGMIYYLNTGLGFRLIKN